MDKHITKIGDSSYLYRMTQRCLDYDDEDVCDAFVFQDVCDAFVFHVFSNEKHINYNK